MSSLIVEVVRIGEIEKHPNADTLSMTHVKGWNCLFKTGDFASGDLAVYVPIDSILPDKLVELYNMEYLKNGARVRSVRLRKILSEGLLLTLQPEWKFREGQDVAKILGITKWEPPAPSYQGTPNLAKGNKNRPNPNFKRYTEIENVKNFNGVFKDGDEVVITEKIHGTNFRAGWVPLAGTAPTLWGKIRLWWMKLHGKTHEFAVGSHNVHLIGDNPQFYEGNVYWKIAKRYKLEALLPKGYVLFGEIYGEGIQDLTYGMKGIDVMFFDLMKEGEYAEHDVCMVFCELYRFPTVPELFRGTYHEGIEREMANGKSVLCAAQMREGCVVKAVPECRDNRIGRKILKSVSEEYLLRKGGTESK